MDNSFVEILFYGFIIFLVLSSLFKKKPQNKGSEQTQSPDEDEYKNSENENPDILKEIENIFDSQKSQNKNPYLSRPEPEDYNLSNEPEEPVPFIENNSDPYRDNISSNNPPAKKDYVSSNVKILDSYLEKEANKFEKYFSLNKGNDELIIKNLREKISNKDLLKEYFIISEILGKPKALRR